MSLLGHTLNCYTTFIFISTCGYNYVLIQWPKINILRCVRKLFGSKNDWHFLEWARRPFPPWKVWERSNNARQLYVRKYCICMFLYLFTDRIAAKRRTASIKFTQRPKIRIFALQGRLVVSRFASKVLLVLRPIRPAAAYLCGYLA